MKEYRISFTKSYRWFFKPKRCYHLSSSLEDAQKKRNKLAKAWDDVRVEAREVTRWEEV